MADKQFNVAIIGYGLSAKVFHIPLIQYVSGLKLAAILQRSPKPDNDASKDHPGVHVHQDLDSLLADNSIEVVVVTSTPETHYQIAKSALQAGKHVVVEKPFAPTSKECFELADIAKSANKLLTVYQNRRWDSDFLTLRSVLPSLGRVAEFETHFDRHRLEAPTNWKAKPTPGNGVIYDLGAHLIDQVLYLYGLPQKVTGFVYSQRDVGIEGAEDSCTVLLHYPKMLATAKAGVVSPEAEQLRFWVRGTEGSFKKFGLDPQENELKAGRTPATAGFGHEPEELYGSLTAKSADGIFEKKVQKPVEPATYAAFYQEFLDALRGSGKVPVEAESSAQVIRTIELAIQSSQEGRTIDFS